MKDWESEDEEEKDLDLKMQFVIPGFDILLELSSPKAYNTLLLEFMNTRQYANFLYAQTVLDVFASSLITPNGQLTPEGVNQVNDLVTEKIAAHKELLRLYTAFIKANEQR